MAVHQKVGGTWKVATVYQNVLGTWKQCNVWKNISGVWQNLSTFFTPDGGNASVSGAYLAQVTLTCSVAAVWTYTGGAGGSANVASGGTSTSITFTATTGPPGAAPPNNVAWAVTGTAGAIVRNFTVNANANGDL